jgi:hypothetical protein
MKSKHLLPCIRKGILDSLLKGTVKWHYEKSINMALRESNVNAGRPLIQLRSLKSCYAAQNIFSFFKGPGSFKYLFKIGGNVDELKDYRTPPPLAPCH